MCWGWGVYGRIFDGGGVAMMIKKAVVGLGVCNVLPPIGVDWEVEGAVLKKIVEEPNHL